MDNDPHRKTIYCLTAIPRWRNSPGCTAQNATRRVYMRKKKATARRVLDTDIAIGERIRAVRNRAGISQEQLGDELQVSFQQIQKYEKGANRVSSGRLLQIATALGCNVIDLIGGMEKGAPKITAASSFAASREGIAIINAMSKIENVDLRRQVIRLAEILAA